jgi:hypothetical protein
MEGRANRVPSLPSGWQHFVSWRKNIAEYVEVYLEYKSEMFFEQCPTKPSGILPPYQAKETIPRWGSRDLLHAWSFFVQTEQVLHQK